MITLIGTLINRMKPLLYLPRSQLNIILIIQNNSMVLLNLVTLHLFEDENVGNTLT